MAFADADAKKPALGDVVAADFDGLHDFPVDVLALLQAQGLVGDALAEAGGLLRFKAVFAALTSLRN